MLHSQTRIGRLVRLAAFLFAGALGNVLVTGIALAHDAPDDGEAAYIMADWMLFSFLAFAGTALIIFVIVLKRGMLRDLEAAKYQVLEIDETDYYTPSWAKEDSTDASQR